LNPPARETGNLDTLTAQDNLLSTKSDQELDQRRNLIVIEIISQTLAKLSASLAAGLPN
jgi:hypothetical protein